MRIIAAFALCAVLLGCDIGSSSAVAVKTGPSEPAAASNSGEEMIGEYLCTVVERASIERLHTEDAGPPEASVEPMFGSQPPTRFKIGISRGAGQVLQLIELPYSGADRDLTEWHTPNSVIHNSYKGIGGSFSPTENGPGGVFVLGEAAAPHVSRDRQLCPSGFGWAGGEDTVLAIRWGRCKKI